MSCFSQRWFIQIHVSMDPHMKDAGPMGPKPMGHGPIGHGPMGPGALGPSLLYALFLLCLLYLLCLSWCGVPLLPSWCSL